GSNGIYRAFSVRRSQRESILAAPMAIASSTARGSHTVCITAIAANPADVAGGRATAAAVAAARTRSAATTAAVAIHRAAHPGAAGSVTPADPDSPADPPTILSRRHHHGAAMERLSDRCTAKLPHVKRDRMTLRPNRRRFVDAHFYQTGVR